MYICNTKEKDMRQFLLLLISSLFLTSCTEQYNIAGNSTVPVLDGRMLYLKVTPNGVTSENIDSCKVIHGRFNFFGAVDSIVLAQVCMENENVMPIVLENGNLTISVDNLGQRVSGGPLNDRLYKFYRQKNRIDNEMWEIQEKAIKMMRVGYSMDVINKKFGKKAEALNKKSEDLETNFIVENSNNVLGPGFFMILCSQYPTPVITEHINNILQRVPSTFFSNPCVKSYIHRAKQNPMSKPFNKSCIYN